ncbi:2'-5' RNA ligase family protein [Actinomycetospora aeridis]|uniref:2'-5' RNA ligase family protein n=1 Tax=Actinomycetospora aeridis TaxID=3129231 RepID=A0ABU8N624_9PSEU
MTDTDPLIVSALLDEETQAELDAQRRRLFPSRRLVVGAHLTLFHALPGARADEVVTVLEQLAQRPPIEARVRAPFALGRGVAYRIEAPGLDTVHAAVARRFADDLTRQDARRPHHHVTVQNKVDGETAKATLAELVASHSPYPATVVGLALWRYRGGPWEAAGEFPFRG